MRYLLVCILLLVPYLSWGRDNDIAFFLYYYDELDLPQTTILKIDQDSKGYIWSGGYYNLKCIDPIKNSVRLYPGVSTVTAIEEKDTHFIWVGTATGLFLLDRNSGEYEYILMPVESTYINTLYQANDGLLYIGTIFCRKFGTCFK